MFLKRLLVKFQIISLFTIIATSFCFAETNKIPPTEVVIIGTIHQLHYEVPAYSPDILKDIIYKLKPAAILNELPLSLVDSDGRPIEKIRHKNNKGGPESWAADIVAQQLEIKQIPFDRHDRNDFYERTNYFKRQEEHNIELNRWFEGFSAKEPNSLEIETVQLIGVSMYAQGALRSELLLTPRITNSAFYDVIIKAKHSSSDIILSILRKNNAPKSLLDECNFFKNVWQERNKIMADNIIKAAKKSEGKRIVVITGSEHRYILRELLKTEDNLKLKEFWKILPEYNK